MKRLLTSAAAAWCCWDRRPPARRRPTAPAPRQDPPTAQPRGDDADRVRGGVAAGALRADRRGLRGRPRGGVSLEFSFAGSSDLVAQIQQARPGGRARHRRHRHHGRSRRRWTRCDRARRLRDEHAHDRGACRQPPRRGRDPRGSRGPPDLTLVVCAEQVPCGNATAKVEQAAGLDFAPVSEEQSVTDVLTKVTSGEADAAWSTSPTSPRPGGTTSRASPSTRRPKR